MIKSNKVLAHAAILGANLIYGVNYSIAKPLMPDYIGPLGLAVLRIVGAIVLIGALGIIVNEKIDRKDWFRLFLCGITGSGINQLAFLYGLNKTTPIDAAIILTTNPVMVLLLSTLVLRERLTKRKIMGVFFAGAGAVMLITQGGKVSFINENVVGNLFILLNAFSYAVYLILVKRLMSKYHPITVLKWVFVFGSMLIIPFGAQEFSSVDWTNLPWNIILSMAFVVIGTTFFAYLFNIYGIKHVSPSVVSAYIYSQPVIASLAAIVLKQDSLSLVKVLSTLLVFVGVYLVSTNKNGRNRTLVKKKLKASA